MIKIKISILSNTNVDLLVRRFSKENEVYTPLGYGNWVGEILQDESDLNKFCPKAIFFLLDGQELLNPYEKNCEASKEIVDDYISYVNSYARKKRDITLFISSLDIPIKKIQSIKDVRVEKILENYWYEKLVELSKKNKNVYVFDLKKLIEENGRKNFYSNKMWYLGGIKYSYEGEILIKEEISRYLNALQGKKKKCLVLDLDNTLWGGIVGEDGINGINLSENKEGARYKDFQKRIKEIKNIGTILAISSKNNYEDALEVLKNHKEMVLKEDDFVNMKINWTTKVENIEEISRELNIGLDSLIFIDDNPVERESVEVGCIGVEVPDFPLDTSNLEDYIIDIYNEYLLTLDVTNEDRSKSDMYESNVKRKTEMENAISFEQFLNNLETRVNIWRAREEDIDRISQLTQKTNQFNLTTKRYTDSDIRRFLASDDYDIYVISVEDKFGDNGKVSVVILKKERDIVELDTFIMSCRVMGRLIEDVIIDYIENKYKEKGYEELISYYIPTSKNKPVKEFFERLSYEVIESKDDGYRKYKLNLYRNNYSRKKYAELYEI